MLQLLQFISAQSDAVKPGEIAILLFLSYFRFLLVLCWPLHSEELIGSAPSIAQYHHHLHRIAEKYFLALREPKNRVKDGSPFLLCSVLLFAFLVFIRTLLEWALSEIEHETELGAITKSNYLLHVGLQAA